MYKCPDCGYSAEENGNCPMCNVPMEESKEGGDEFEYDNKEEE